MLDIALIKNLNKNHIPTASFQHGVAREISEDILCVDSLFEATLVDVSYVFVITIRKLLKRATTHITKFLFVACQKTCSA